LDATAGQERGGQPFPTFDLLSLVEKKIPPLGKPLLDQSMEAPIVPERIPGEVFHIDRKDFFGGHPGGKEPLLQQPENRTLPRTPDACQNENIRFTKIPFQLIGVSGARNHDSSNIVDNI
jgi:hypothetical protein